MATLALAPFHDGPKAHLVSNVDGAHIADTLGVAAFALGAKGAFAASIEEITKRGVMHVVTEDDFYPYEFIKGGKP